MKNANQERIIFWDILKGLGIISIVFGHSQGIRLAIRMVYYYHLAIFFFIAGYFFSEKRYGDHPFDFFSRRLKTVWVPYLCYGTLFVFLHNFLARMHIFPATEYQRKDHLYALVSTALLKSPESTAGAMWFIPFLLTSSILFSIIIWFCRCYIPASIRPLAIAAISMGTGLLGIFLFQKEIYLDYHLHRAALVTPVYYSGYLWRNKQKPLSGWIRWSSAAISVGLIWYYLMIANQTVELSANVIPTGLNFYVVSAAGICLCCFVAWHLQKCPHVNKFIATLGKYSFDIMALHFLVFKIIDWIYGTIHHATADELGGFPYSYPQLRPLYLLLGLLVPLLLSYHIKKWLSFFNHKIKAWVHKSDDCDPAKSANRNQD